MKILYYIETLGLGGREKMVALKSGYLANKGYDVIILTKSQGDSPVFFNLDSKIRHYDLNLYSYIDRRNFIATGNVIIDFFKKIGFSLYKIKLSRLHHKLLKEKILELSPDIICNLSIGNYSSIINLKEGNYKLIHEYHGSPIYDFESFFYRFQKRLFWLLYKRRIKLFDSFIVLTEEGRSIINSITKIDNIRVIPNPITIENKEPSLLENKTIITMGRLSYEKQYPEMVEIWGMIAKKYPDWKLEIWGEGIDEENIKRKIIELKLEDNVQLCGLTKDPVSKYKEASIFIMTSCMEGLPLVLLESQVMGLPAITYACPTGPRDIIQDGKNGFLIENNDKEAFANKIEVLINDSTLRKRMGEEAFENSKKYYLEPIMQKWISLFNELTNNE